MRLPLQAGMQTVSKTPMLGPVTAGLTFVDSAYTPHVLVGPHLHLACYMRHSLLHCD